jgi:penicillin-binding protein 2
LASAGAPAGRFLPPDPRIEEPYLFTPRMALRVAILAGATLVVFAVLFLRLWSLQILSGSKYASVALDNQLRTVRLPAPRGLIEDREGRVLVTNVASTAVDVWPADLPKQGRYAEMRRLAAVLHMRLPKVLAKLERSKGDLLTPVTIQVAVHEDQVEYLREHALEFPGVHTRTIYLRQYKTEALLAHVLGYVGEISPQQVEALRRSCHLPSDLCPQPGDEIGQTGVEAAYDGYLRGQPEIDEVHVNALGVPIGKPVPRSVAVPGSAVRLTIDISLQRAAERALRDGIQLAHADGHWLADGGAIVAMDPNTGEILAMASSPTFKPSVFVGRTSAKKLAPLLNPAVAKKDNYPGLNRAVAGLYPPGSTFKPVTALAAMQEHVISPFQTLQCTPTFTVHGQVFKNWDPFSDRPMTLPEAIAASCDTYFYQLGYDFYALPADRGHPLQGWASRFGFGAPTGIDIGGEPVLPYNHEVGLLPTPEWRQATYTAKTDPGHWQIDRLWKPGDSIQLAIGQKDLLVTPLQMVRFYAMIANGGKLVKPHVVDAVGRPGGGMVPINPPLPTPTGVDPAALQVVRDGLYQATHASFGTATSVFGAFPIPVAGKTGTAEKVVQPPGYAHPVEQDQSWWCGYAPADAPRIAVCAVIENGGHGGTAAAPAALRVFEHYFHRSAGPIGTIYSD